MRYCLCFFLFFFLLLLQINRLQFWYTHNRETECLFTY